MCLALKRYLFLQLITSQAAVIFQVQYVEVCLCVCEAGLPKSGSSADCSSPPCLQLSLNRWNYKRQQQTSLSNERLNCFQITAAAWAAVLWLLYWQIKERLNVWKWLMWHLLLKLTPPSIIYSSKPQQSVHPSHKDICFPIYNTSVLVWCHDLKSMQLVILIVSHSLYPNVSNLVSVHWT